MWPAQQAGVWVPPTAELVGGAYLGGLLGGKGRVLELPWSMDSAGYCRGLSVWRKGEGETEAHTQATLPAPISLALLPLTH